MVAIPTFHEETPSGRSAGGRRGRGRGGVHAARLLEGFSGVLQVDGYAAYEQLARPTRSGGPVTLAFCWSHLRRKFYEPARVACSAYLP